MRFDSSRSMFGVQASAGHSVRPWITLGCCEVSPAEAGTLNLRQLFLLLFHAVTELEILIRDYQFGFRFHRFFAISFPEATISSNFAAGHNAVPSEPEVAMRFPSGENATEVTGPPSWASVNATRWLATDQKRIVPSQLVETSVLSSGAKANPVTPSVWPSRRAVTPCRIS